VTPRQDLASIADELAQRISVLVIDVVNLVDTEEVDFAPPEKAAPATATTRAATSASATSATGTTAA